MLCRYRLAVGLWLCAVAMVFVAFISAYVVRGGVPNYEAGRGAYSTQWEPPFLPGWLLILNSGVLLAASGALELARRKARRAAELAATGPAFPIWIWVSGLLSAGFLAGQTRAWQILHAHGHTIASGARAAFFYVVTGAHAAQIAALVLVLFWIVARQAGWQPIRKFIVVDLSAWYLHAMTLLWIALVCVLLWV